ncbi:MAG: response regulator [Candidatus Izimaplasma sp.]|nr:response regulator [Candidatus Izimaplasma bacterium]
MDNNYRMILVDDEDDVRGRILSKINPESGFDVVGKAGNGYDALELIEKYNPHIVLTDIKMPFIDGIELARIVRRDFPTTKVAFISGYDEFHYARKAIELNVVSYLMKPVTSNDIDNFLKKLKISLDEEFDFLSNTKLIQKKYSDSIPMLINSYLSSYRNKSELNNDDITHLEQYNIDFSLDNYIVGVIELDKCNDLSVTEESKIFIGSLIEKVFNNLTYCHHFLIPEGVIFILKDEKIKSSRDIDLELYEIIKYSEEYRQITLRIGISRKFKKFTNYPNASRESEHALRHSIYFNLGRIFYYDDIEEKERKHILIEESELEEFTYILKYGKKTEIKECIEKIIDLKFKKESSFLLDPQLLIIKLANILIDFASSINVNISDIISGNIVEEMFAFKNSEDLKEFIYNAIIKMREKNALLQVNKTEKIIEDVYRYIEKEYSNSIISLESMTDELNISISYLSMLLKKHKGVTFNKELIKYRMEKAKELLKYSDEKIITISKLCGYNEVYYFSHSFKKYTGLSPKEFRKNV